jgi:peptidoglycan/LPS O-acetylase OafA/YrhL
VARGWFRFDYLMPAELFPSVLVGGGLLLWAAVRVRSNRRLIGWSLAAAVCMLVGGQTLAVLTGLASGDSEPVGFWWALVILSLVVYVVSVAAMGAGGIRLLRELFSPRPQTGEGR